MTKKKSLKNKLGTGISLDIACGANKQKGFIGMDIRPLPDVDIVHDIRIFPWPLKDNTVDRVIMSHILEHIQDTMGVMAEVHRICKHDATVMISVPYWQSVGAWQDPTHVKCFNENTFYYFDDRNFLWTIYKPPVFHIEGQTFMYSGNMETILTVIKEPIDEQQKDESNPEDSSAESSDTEDNLPG